MLPPTRVTLFFFAAAARARLVGPGMGSGSSSDLRVAGKYLREKSSGRQTSSAPFLAASSTMDMALARLAALSSDIDIWTMPSFRVLTAIVGALRGLLFKLGAGPRAPENVFAADGRASFVHFPLSPSLLQSAVTTTGASQSTPVPLWVTAAELIVVLAVIAAGGTILTRLVRDVVLKAGGSKSVVTSITQWMGVLMLLAAAGAVTTVAGLSSYLTALTLSGIAGLAISLALQNTISNVIAGVLLQHDGVVRLGDDVQYGSGGVRGEVVKLSLRTTWLRTQAGVVIVIANSSLSAGPVINYSAGARLEKKLDD